MRKIIQTFLVLALLWATALPAQNQSVQTPVTLTISASSAHSVTLTWTASSSSGVTGYKIYKSTDGTTYSNIASVGGTVLTYKDTAVTAGQTLWYKVTAFNSSAESGFSPIWTGVVPSP